MPSGRTHDSITLWSLPIVAGATFASTQSGNLTLLLSGGYLFSGLMFGPDLDVYSRQYKRWGVLRWIWLPYRRSMRHRAFLSHGPMIGTLVRLVYLFSWLGAGLGLVALISAIAYWMTGEIRQWMQLSQHYWTLGSGLIGRSLQTSLSGWIALLLGLELGALSHSMSDWVGSYYKRQVTHHRRKLPKPRSSKPQKVPPTLSTPAHPSMPPSAPPASSPRVELPSLPPPIQSDSKLPPIR